MLFSLVASSLGSVHPAKQATPGSLLRIARAAHALDAISKKSQNAVPDAVLNSTKCVVVIPSITSGTQKVSTGVASCREDQISGALRHSSNSTGAVFTVTILICWFLF